MESYTSITNATDDCCDPIARKYHSSMSHAFTLMTLHRTMKMKTFQPPVTGGYSSDSEPAVIHGSPNIIAMERLELGF